MATSNNASGGGIGFLGLLQIAFIVLKLMDFIDWSWWWVLSPFLMLFGICFVCFLIVLTHH